MAQSRMAGMDIFQKIQSQSQRDLQENMRIRSIMERQRQRDVAAASGRIIPFSADDII